MRKAYEVKIYAVDGTYKSTLKTGERITDLRFSNPLNSGQGECEIELDLPISSTAYSEGDFAVAFVYDDLRPAGTALFTGQINRVDRVYAYGRETVKLRCLGLGALLSFLYFKSGGSYAFTKNQSCGQTVKDVVDYFNSVYPGGWLSYVPAEIEAGPTANLSFDYVKAADALKKCSEVSGFSWRIDPDGRVLFFDKPGTVTHKPKLQADVQGMQVRTDSEKIVNRYVLAWASGTVTAQDAGSQASYGVRELKVSDSSVLDSGTAQARADAYVAANKDPKKKVSLTLNASYSFGSGTGSIEDVRPGETVTVLNSPYPLSNLQIARCEYTPEELRLDLEEYDSFGKEVIS